MGGQTKSFLTYNQFLDLFQNYPNLVTNVEIKGTIEPHNALAPQTNPTITEQLTKTTPENIKKRIVWSSFSSEMLADFKRLNPTVETAQLFCEPKDTEPLIFKGLPDRYLQFTLKNIKQIHKEQRIKAAHVEISTLNDDEILIFCLKNHIKIRTWSLLERNPEKDAAARQNLIKVFKLAERYPDLNIGIITDYAPAVSQLFSTC